MKKEERLALRIVKKGFTIEQYENFKDEIVSIAIITAPIRMNCCWLVRFIILPLVSFVCDCELLLELVEVLKF